jgi:predicted nuclease of predicted toxin-antitoxin system
MGAGAGSALIRFLVDECLSAELLGEAYARGFEAHHVNHLGLRTASDRALMPQIVGGDFTFVTNNRRDFLRLYRFVDVHAGLLIIIPSVDISRQIVLFNAALDAIEAAGDDLIGELVEVDAAGRVTISRYPPDGGNE